MLLRCASQPRFAPNGAAVGIDIGLALLLAEALGYDLTAVADLLPGAEAGLLDGIARLRNESDS